MIRWRSIFRRTAGIAAIAMTSVSAGHAAAVPTTSPATASVDEASVLNDTKSLKLYPLGRHPAGVVRIAGSTTVGHALHVWAEEYGRLQPDVTIKISGGGSSAGFPALLAGQADFAALSRPATDAELASFKAKFGYAPTSILVGVDALAVFVNKDNPVPLIHVAMLDALYSRIPQHNAVTADTWGEFGLEGDWANLTPKRFGSPTGRGDYDLFKSTVLLNGRLRLDVDVDAFPSSIVQAVGADRAAVGYASVAYKTPAVRAVPIAGNDNMAYAPTRENVLSRKYALSRPLLLYFNRVPNQTVTDSLADFGLFVTSQIGQQTAGDAGIMTIDVASQADTTAKLSR